MASKQTGRAAVFGFPGGVSYTGVATFIKESGEIEHNYQVDELRDDDNELLGLAHSGEVYEGTLMFTAIAASGTNTLANAKEALLPPVKGSQVTLSSFPQPSSPGIHGLNKADWVYVGGWKLAFKKNGFATYQMKIKRSPNNDISTQVS